MVSLFRQHADALGGVCSMVEGCVHVFSPTLEVLGMVSMGCNNKMIDGHMH